MADLDQLREDLRAAREAEKNAAHAIRQHDVSIADKEAELAALKRARAQNSNGGVSDEDIAICENELNDLLEQRADLVDELADARVSAQDHLETFVETYTTPEGNGSPIFNEPLKHFRPVMLFPVRLETVFRDPGYTGDEWELWVRIYPDDIHVESHEEALTREEVAAGERFWKAIEATGSGANPVIGQGTPEEESKWREIWAELVSDTTDAQRAAYVKNVTDPSGSGTGEIMLRADDWTRTPEARSLPDRWVVMGVRYDSGMVDTGYKSPTANGDDYNSWSSPSGAYSSGGTSASVSVQGLMHDFFNFNFEFGSVGEIEGIEVSIVGASQPFGTMSSCNVALSWDGGSSYTSSKPLYWSSPFFSAKTVGGEQDTWDRSWSASEFGNLSFRVRLEKTNSFTILQVDYIQVRVFYSNSDSIAMLGTPENAFDPVYLNPIPHPLPLAPTTLTETTEVFGDSGIKEGSDIFDSRSRWVVDFDEAIKVGMGVKIKLGYQKPKKINVLMALGVKASLDYSMVTQHLKELLDNHRYTGGMGFLRQGTPTNAGEAERSGYTENQLADRTFDIEFRDESDIYSTTPLNYVTGCCNADNVNSVFGFANVAEETKRNFGRLENGDLRENDQAFKMNFVLWRSTMGYFMDHMMNEWKRVIDDKDVTNPDAVPPRFGPQDNLYGQAIFSGYVRGGGVFPTLRIGKQPYGILPVTSWDLYQGSTPQEAAIAEFIKKLRDTFWIPSIDNVTTIDSKIGSVRDVILDVLSQSRLNREIYYRPVLGLQHFINFTEVEKEVIVISEQNYEWPPFVDSYRAITGAALDDLGLGGSNGWLCRAQDLMYYSLERLLNGPTVQEGELSETEPLRKENGNGGDGMNYIEWMADYETEGRWKEVDSEAFEGYENPSKVPLLYQLLRHSYLLELAWHPIHYGGAQHDSEEPNRVIDRSVPEDFNEDEYLHVNEDFKATGDAGDAGDINYLIWLYTYCLCPPERGGDYMADVRLHEGGSGSLYDDHYVDSSFFSFWENLADLATHPTAALDRNLRYALDCCSHRLDAWFTALATRRWHEYVVELREGMQLGGYGWVLDLEPRSTDRSVGYVVAPSAAHASTAAVLRGAQIAHSNDTDTKNLLGVNLSSVRAREAQYLIDAIRQGQPLGSLLGYRFERGLHETSQLQPVELDQYILPFRKLCPLVAHQLKPQAEPSSDLDNESIEAVAASNVVDGLALVRLYRNRNEPDTPQIPWDENGLPPPSGDAHDAVIEVLEKLERSFDAVADTVLAESVYQGIQGNPVREGGVLNSVSRCDSPLPEMEVIKTPRSGYSFTHRALIMTPSAISGSGGSGGSGWADTPRALAEPRLNAWVAQMIGSPFKVKCLVQFHAIDDEESGSGAEPEEVTLNLLEISPLDVVYDAASEVDARESTLGQRVLTYISDSIPEGYAPKVIFSLDSELAEDEQDFDSLISLGESLRRLITGGRPLLPEDTVISPDSEEEGSGTIAAVSVPDLEEFEQRVTAANTTLGEILDILEEATSSGTGEFGSGELEELRQALIGASNFGVASAQPGAIIAALEPDTDNFDIEIEELKKLSAAILPDVQRRKENSDRLIADFIPGSGTTDNDYIRHYTACMRAMFGDGFCSLVQYEPANRDELINALSVSEQIQRNDRFAVTTWMQRMSRVRSGIEAFSEVMLFVDALSGSDPTQLKVAQLPYMPPDEGQDVWIALEQDEDETEPWEANRLSLVIQAEDDFIEDQLAGLVVDEWVETIPSRKASASMGVHYDSPGSRAPQSILQAIMPAWQGFEWNVWVFQKIILDTIKLMKVRMVDAETIDLSGNINLTADGIGQFLPATLFTMNFSKAPSMAESPDHSVLTETAQEISTDFRRNIKPRTGGSGSG